MKKSSILSTIFLLLSILLILSGCTSNTSTSTGYVIVTSFDRNVSISVPSGWNTNDPAINPGSIIAVSDDANFEHLVITEEPKTSLGTNSTIDDYWAQIKTAFIPVVPDAVWGNASNVTVAGFQGLTAQVIGTWKSNNTTFFVYALASEDYYYTIVGLTTTSLADANKATLQKIINSFIAPVTTGAGGWRPYSFPGSVILSFILLFAGIGLVLFGRRLKNRVQIPHPGKVVRVVMVVICVLLIFLFLSMVTILTRRYSGSGEGGLGPIFPITLTCAVATFIYLAYISRRHGLPAALGNALVGAAAGPMVFEFPFDLIVIPHVKASVTFISIYFVSLDVAVLMTLSLLLLSRRVYITRFSLYALGAMFLVFAVWALFGFPYPSTPLSFVLNSVSKVLGFISVAALFSRDSSVAASQPVRIPQTIS